MERRGFGQFHGHAFGHFAVLAHVVDEALEPRLVARRRARDIDRELDVFVRIKLRHGHLERPAIDETHEAERFGGGNELACGRDRTVIALEPQQAFVVLGLPGARAHDGLIGEDQTVSAQRRHDLVADRDQAAAGGFALLRFGEDRKAVAPGRFGALERFLGAQHRFLTVGRRLGAATPHRARRSRTRCRRSFRSPRRAPQHANAARPAPSRVRRIRSG